MQFNNDLKVDAAQLHLALGYAGTLPDAATLDTLQAASRQIEASARSRWCWGQFALQHSTSGLLLAGIPLMGTDIAAHLNGCTACVMLALTLGAVADSLIRAAQASDMARAVILDAAASTLIEQYADEAEESLRAQFAAPANDVSEGNPPAPMYLTSRFSPGYGNLPIELQRPLLALVNAPRAIGLTASSSSILLPRKSITALLGLAPHPVSGRQAKCQHCALWQKCHGTANCAL